ncbi:uncharacterized protein LOC128157925 [Crassostrea angulata]|uniref:uncharacterized protein LOC128157925 n=1 Tax=Magallana angulata TaxID=2784310 RepID=UPI0022B08FE8|nr:uncharacterized protein LOC128157925 [Crassostrea angulata]XP_052676558.1 uncharacterized protein LOC128157925 [Crassostrea angulata]
MSTSVLIFIFVPSVVFALPSWTAPPQIQQENPFTDQLVFGRQQPSRSLDSIASPRNALLMISTEERQDLCQICQSFTSEKPLECKTYCAKILKCKTSATKSGSYSDSREQSTATREADSREQSTAIGDAVGDPLCAFCEEYKEKKDVEECKTKFCSE